MGFLLEGVQEHAVKVDQRRGWTGEQMRLALKVCLRHSARLLKLRQAEISFVFVLFER